MPSKGTDEERVLHSKSDNIEIITDNTADELIKEPLRSIFFQISNRLRRMKVSDFIFDYVDFLF